VPLESLRISGGGQTRTVPAPKPGRASSYAVGLPRTSTLRISAVYTGPLLTGPVSFSAVHIDDLHPQRWLALPRPLDDAPVDVVALSRDPDRFPCVQVRTAFTCDDLLAAHGEDGDTLAREVTVPHPTTFRIAATASLRRHQGSWRTLLRGTGVRAHVQPAEHEDPAEAPAAAVDGDPATTWVSRSAKPRLDVTLPQTTRVDSLRLTINPGAPASLPGRLLVRAGDRHKVVDVGPTGRVRLPGWSVRRLSLRVESVQPALAPTSTGSYRTLPPGITELQVNDGSVTANAFHQVEIPCGQGPRVDVAGTTLVDTVDTVILFETALEPRLYVDPSLVGTHLLRRSDTASYCNYKGAATYWSTVIGGTVVYGVAWSYQDPLPESLPIKGFLSFDAARADVVAELPGLGRAAG